MKPPLETAYADVWHFHPPRSCREMHEAGLFDPRSPRFLTFAVNDVYEATSLAEGDAFVTESLVPGLVPIGGDRSGDRWCFDTRRKIAGTTPVLFCPHDGGGARFVAPSFASFVFRLIAFNLALPHLFVHRQIDASGMAALTRKNVESARPWLLERWVARLTSLQPAAWPGHDAFDAWLAEDPAFARLPREELDHFRPVS